MTGRPRGTAALAARFLRHRFRRLHPFEVQAVLTNACNLRCRHCRCPERVSETMSTEEWRDLIRRLASLGTLRIKFQGGEPTVRADFRELCAAAQEAGLVAAVTTNGQLIAERPALLDHLDELVVSVDGATPAAHDRVRGAGTHERALRAVELGVRQGIPTYVNMVVNRENLGEVEPLLALCERVGASFNAQPVMFDRWFYDPAARSLGLDGGQIRGLWRGLARWKRAGRRVIFAAATYERVARWPDYGEPTRRGRVPSGCMAGRCYVHVDPEGDVHPCGQHRASFAPLNLRTHGLEPALLHARRHDCADCSSAYLNERRLLFALHPAAAFESLRRLARALAAPRRPVS